MILNYDSKEVLACYVRLELTRISNRLSELLSVSRRYRYS